MKSYRILLTLLFITFWSMNSNAWPWEDKTISTPIMAEKEPAYNQTAPSSEPLPMDEAFMFSAHAKDASTLIATWDIHPEYHIYRNKFFIDIKGADFGDINWPKGEEKEDLLYGTVEVHKGLLVVELPLKKVVGGSVEFTAKYQGCWSGGVCYPPTEKVLVIEMLK
jgi:thiol:disulfide interchange protein DsbD